MTHQQTALAGPGRVAHGDARAAFSLTELLVVVSVMGVMFMLLLPAIMSSRECARRASCTNNLVQLIMAVHQYESVQRVYPPGSLDPVAPIKNQLSGYHHNWIAQVLPFLEQQTVYHHIDRNVGVYHPNNRLVRSRKFYGLVCPSSYYGADGYSNYVALHHDVESAIDVDQNGIFFLNSGVRSDDVLDGTSNTIFVGEKMNELFDLGWMSGTRATLRNTGESINHAKTQIRQRGMASNVPPGYWPYPGDYDPVNGKTDAGNAVPVVGTKPRQLASFVGGFSSHHNRGANFVLGDGQVRFISETVSMRVYRRLGNRQDGHLLDDVY